MLLDTPGRNQNQLSQNLDGLSGGQSTPDASSTVSKRLTNRLSQMSGGGIVGLQRVGSKDPYFRQPRRNTMDALGGAETPLSPGWSDAGMAAAANENAVEDDPVEGMSTQAKPEPEDLEDITSEIGTTKKPKKDYAVREVDFYYGVRGPALSSGTRRLKTGPADPTGPVSSATGWFKSMLGRKAKEKHKGFEVVRSARAPPPGLFPPTPETPGHQPEAYHDNPSIPTAARHDRIRTSTISPPYQRESLYDDEPDRHLFH